MNAVRIDWREMWRVLGKCVGDSLVFFGLARTGGVDQAPARGDDRGRVLEHPPLGGGERRQVGFLTPPPDVGIASQSAKA